MVISNCELLRAMYILRRPLLLKNEDCFMSWILFWRWCWILLFVLENFIFTLKAVLFWRWFWILILKDGKLLEVVLDTEFEKMESHWNFPENDLHSDC